MPARSQKDTVRNLPFLDKLNPVQREAVLHYEGPLLLFAGAGSGKTRVLTHRIAYLIAARSVAPWEILAVTFTNKAAKEMRSRLEGLIGEYDTKKIQMGTFHSVCARILRRYGEDVNIPDNFVIYDDSDQITVMKECMRMLTIDQDRFTPRAILSHISKAKEKLIDPNEYNDHYFGFFEDICGLVYPKYQEELRKNNALDFDDILVETVRLLRNSPTTLRKLQTQIRFILVDEYQDVNLVQYEFLRLLAKQSSNICVVGDDDQSVYGWRGADVGLILRFEVEHPDVKVLKLEQNYRSTRTILDAAYAVVSNNQSRKDKRLWTEKEGGDPIVHYEAENEKTEAQWLATTIKEMVEKRGYKWSDFAVLYRTNAQSRVVEDLFRAFNIPHKIIGGTRFYDRKELKDTIAYLRVIHNHADGISMKRIINEPPRGIGKTTLSALETEALLANTNLWEVLHNSQVVGEQNKRARTSLNAFVELMDALVEDSRHLNVPDLMQKVIEMTGYSKLLSSEKSMEAESRLENLTELLKTAAEYQFSNEEPTLGGFLESISLVSDIDSLSENSEAVLMMTLHAAKGLEFRVVFMIGMEENIFPHSRSHESAAEMEEERRLCYVGITRAQELLFISNALTRSTYTGLSFNHPSRFLEEIPIELFTGKRGKPSVSSFDPDEDALIGLLHREKTLWDEGELPPQEQAYRKQIGEFRVGHSVKHAIFGVGVILKVEGNEENAKAEIMFPIHGLKKIMLTGTHLTRVK